MRIKQVLEEEKPKYVLRADIKSFYASIPHYRLVQDIKKHYDDPKVVAMLENIITNPIDTPRGTKNPSQGIALRGRGPCERHARTLNKWSLLESLSDGSGVICIAGLHGGKTLQTPGRTRNSYSNLLMSVGMRPLATMQAASINFTS